MQIVTGDAAAPQASNVNFTSAAPAGAGSVQPAPNQAVGDADGELGPNVKVYLVNLNSTPELNNTTGVITKWDDSLSRWRVKMDVDGKTKALKSENLRVVGSA